MNWKTYAAAVLVFNYRGFISVYALQRLQGALPLNPQGFAAVSPDSAFNTAISFASNANWQGYGSESTLSYLSQMLGLGAQHVIGRGMLRPDASGHPQSYAEKTISRRQILFMESPSIDLPELL